MDALFQKRHRSAIVEFARIHLHERSVRYIEITTLGIDLGKNVFQVHGVDCHGKPVLRRQLDRSKVLPFFVRLEPCLIGMEACGSAHYWARKLVETGHTVKPGNPTLWQGITYCQIKSELLQLNRPGF